MFCWDFQDDPANYQTLFKAVNQLPVDCWQAEGHQLMTTSQNIAEFWNVSTRPTDQNGFGKQLLKQIHSCKS